MVPTVEKSKKDIFMKPEVFLSEKFVECLESTMSDSLDQMFEEISETRVRLSDVLDCLGHVKDAVQNPSLFQDSGSARPPTLEKRVAIFLTLFEEIQNLADETHDSLREGMGDLPEYARLAAKILESEDV